MPNENLTNAKNAKNDEFYTQYYDIEKEITSYLEFNPKVFKGKTVLLPCDDPEWSNFTKFFAQNFERFGLKKLISTSYAVESKIYKSGYQPTLFERNDPQFDKNKTRKNGKIFILERDKTGDKKIDVNDLEWQYLEGDGDFRSDEIKKLREKADIIITNPPFSLFREFLAWIMASNKQYVIIGSKSAITYKEVFPLIIANKMWVGTTSYSKDMLFISPEEIDPTQKPSTATRTVDGEVYLRSPSVWFTNIDHGRRHKPLKLMSMADNLRFNKKFKGKKSYDRYDNYNAIEVPFTDAIPSDYKGVMGVPISFLDKFNPDQFVIVGLTSGRDEFECIPTKKYKNPKQHNPNGSKSNGSKANTRATIKLNRKPTGIYYTAENVDKPLSIVYARILIKHKKFKK